MSVKKTGIKVNESDLLCKNNCGFFGNPAWHYYCSVCYRNVYLKKEKTSTTSEFTQNSLNSFSKFEEKRRSRTLNTIKNVSKVNKEHEYREDTYNAGESKNRFEKFLSKHKKILVTDIYKQLKVHLDALEEAKYVKIEIHSDLVQKFYERLSDRIQSEYPYKGLTEDQAEQLLSEVERYLTVKIYDWAFKPNISDDEKRDLDLQKKIRSLHWITPQILDAQIDEENEAEKPHFEDALSAMIEMNTLLCPEDKLQCIVRCCKSVIETIQAHKISCAQSNEQSSQTPSASTVVNADDFLPGLIYIIIRANPTLLHSNIHFIMRFSRPSRINSGEDGYMFTNISIAVEFIENLTHKSLNMTEEEFQDAMQGITRPKSAASLSKSDSSQLHDAATKETLTAMFNGLHVLDNNEAIFKKLSEKADVLENNLIQLSDEIEVSGESINQKIQSLQSSIPLSFTYDYWGDLSHDSEIARSRCDATSKNSNTDANSNTLPLVGAVSLDDPLTGCDKASSSGPSEILLPEPLNPIKLHDTKTDPSKPLNKHQIDYFLKN